MPRKRIHDIRIKETTGGASFQEDFLTKKKSKLFARFDRSPKNAVETAKQPTPMLEKPTERQSDVVAKDGEARINTPKVFEIPKHRGFSLGGTGSPRRYSRSALWGVASLALLFLILSVATLFEGATIIVTPRTKTVSLDAVFAAERGLTSGVKDALPFEVMQFSLALEREVNATEMKNVERRASGKIVIVNNYNSAEQRLIRNTRFETTEGLVYRIYESVVVPGMTKVDGKLIPGSVEVTVHADLPGERYNIDKAEFTIPGFKGTPRFTTFSARTVSPIEGGWSGAVKTISEEEAAKIQAELRGALKKQLIEKAVAEKPADFVLFDGGVSIQFAPSSKNAEAGVAERTVTVREEGSLYGIIFPRESLFSYLGEKLLPQMSPEEEVEIVNIAALAFSVENKDAFNPAEDSRLTFSLKGEPEFVWKFNGEKIREALTGRSKDSLKNVMGQFSGVVKAEVLVRPFWKREFPENPKDIDVKSTLDY
ncbi:MAG: hypothetical protein HY457_00215 [Parcubacteria group bacterium]|nr:hypothetical protein [Parcubacteria group bacterium]